MSASTCTRSESGKYCKTQCLKIEIAFCQCTMSRSERAACSSTLFSSNKNFCDGFSMSWMKASKIDSSHSFVFSESKSVAASISDMQPARTSSRLSLPLSFSGLPSGGASDASAIAFDGQPQDCLTTNLDGSVLNAGTDSPASCCRSTSIAFAPCS